MIIDFGYGNNDNLEVLMIERNIVICVHTTAVKVLFSNLHTFAYERKNLLRRVF